MNFLQTRNGRRFLFGALYLSEGAPIGYLWWALPTKLRLAEIPVEEITALTSLLVVPWTFKFLWAPLVDSLRSEKWTLRSWIVSTQVLMGATLIPLLFLDLHDDFAMGFSLLLLHAFTAATQDVSVDALCVRVVPSVERGAINGWMQTGMLGGRAAFGGGALLLSQRVGDEAVIILLVAAVWFSTLLVLLSRQPDGVNQPSGSLKERFNGFLRLLASAGRRRTTWLALLFAGIAGAGFEAVGAVAGPFLVDRGQSQDMVGWFFALPVVIGMVVGALVGGYISDRLGRRRTVAVFLTLLAGVVCAIAFADGVFEDSGNLLIALLSLLYFCIGLFTASSYALFMDLTDPNLGATQFSAYMGATNACEVWATFAVGRSIGAFGYAPSFAMFAGLSLLALPVLRLIGSKKGTTDEHPSVNNGRDLGRRPDR